MFKLITPPQMFTLNENQIQFIAQISTKFYLFKKLCI